MNGTPLLSLCIPTSGVPEWVFPVLDSIFRQSADDGLFEVVVTDNGSCQEFKKKIRLYAERHPNLVYAETSAARFTNEIAACQKARGELIKFVNHRTLLVPGALERLLGFADRYRERRPIVYFANGVLSMSRTVHSCASFDSFVRQLSFWSSWSTGLAVWKADLEKLPKELSRYNALFPHTDILFHQRDRDWYLIDNTILFSELPQGRRPKGHYDLFRAFGIEYPRILCSLLAEESISSGTFRSVLEDNLGFLARLYYLYCVRGEYCSYDLSGLEDMYGVFYRRQDLKRKLLQTALRRLRGRLAARTAIRKTKGLAGKEYE